MASLLLLSSLALLTLAAPPPVDSNALRSRGVSDTLSNLLNNLQDGVSADDIKQSILPDYWSIPTTKAITKALGLNDTGIRALPLEFLNIPLVYPLSYSSCDYGLTSDLDIVDTQTTLRKGGI